MPDAAIPATRTVTFGELKPCHLLQPALTYCGELTVADIGLGTDHEETPDLEGMDEDDLARAWPYPNERSDKYARGAVGVDTGSDQYPGAAVMSTYGAVYGGAGYVRFLGAERPAATISAQLPNVVFSPVAFKPISSARAGGIVVTARRCSQLRPSRACRQWLTPMASDIYRNRRPPPGC